MKMVAAAKLKIAQSRVEPAVAFNDCNAKVLKGLDERDAETGLQLYVSKKKKKKKKSSSFFFSCLLCIDFADHGAYTNDSGVFESRTHERRSGQASGCGCHYRSRPLRVRSLFERVLCCVLCVCCVCVCVCVQQAEQAERMRN